MDSSFASITSNNKNFDLNQSINSNLNNSCVSEVSVEQFKKKISLKEYFEQNKEFKRFKEVLNTASSNKNIVLLIDSQNNIWELVKRKDLNINALMNPDSISTIVGQSTFNDDDRLLNIEIKENYEDSFNSDLDMSRNTEFNFSSIIKETNNDISDIK